MSLRKPLVLDDNQSITQLQNQDDTDTPLRDRVLSLEDKFQSLVRHLLEQDIEVPDDLTN
jgi:hypothetical protein